MRTDQIISHASHDVGPQECVCIAEQDGPSCPAPAQLQSQVTPNEKEQLRRERKAKVSVPWLVYISLQLYASLSCFEQY